MSKITFFLLSRQHGFISACDKMEHPPWRKQFTRLCGYRETRARKLMNSYIADGLMERIPYSRGYYRPTKGNFGRE